MTTPADTLTAHLGPSLAARLTTADQQATAARILTLLADREGPAVARAWMVGLNPLLDDRSPLAVIAAGRAEDVMTVAHAYLNGAWT